MDIQKLITQWRQSGKNPVEILREIMKKPKLMQTYQETKSKPIDWNLWSEYIIILEQILKENTNAVWEIQQENLYIKLKTPIRNTSEPLLQNAILFTAKEVIEKEENAPYVKQIAFNFFGENTKAEDQIPYLIEQYQKTKDEDTKGTILYNLGEIESSDAIPFLFEILKSKKQGQYFLPKKSAVQFFKIKNRAGIKFLIKKLESKNKHEQELAEWALTLVPNKQVIEEINKSDLPPKFKNIALLLEHQLKE